MNTIINIGVIGNDISKEVLQASIRKENRFYLKKIFVTDNLFAGIVKSEYPEVEIVDDVKAIINDTAIDLVIISGQKANDLPVLEHLLQSGKHVRVI